MADDDLDKRLTRALEMWRRVAIRPTATRGVVPDFVAMLADQGLVVSNASTPDLPAMAQALTDAGYQVQAPKGVA